MVKPKSSSRIKSSAWRQKMQYNDKERKWNPRTWMNVKMHCAACLNSSFFPLGLHTKSNNKQEKHTGNRSESEKRNQNPISQPDKLEAS